MAAAVHPRSTPAAGLNSSQAQTSAPVFEFRCMFTHDVRKKAKKWHDGSLRFHTFNKRVMVYDDTKNLVGSLHYRSQEDFAEGVELNLDTHVLVQVEEQLGESNTDLTPLLNRQKLDGTDHPVRPEPPTRATLSRINAANSQIKPKSIKELLSGTQGAIGRARLPVKSPYEQRHPLMESQPTEPPPKRRKIDNGKENSVENILTRKQAGTRATDDTSTITLGETMVIHDSSEDEPGSPRPDRQVRPRTRSTSSRSDKASSVAITRKPAKRKTTPLVNSEHKRRRSNLQDDSEMIAPSSPRREKHVARTSKKTTSKEAADHVSTRSRPATSMASTTPAPNSGSSPIQRSSGPRSNLRFAAEKPRPKLMYRALLEHSSKPRSSLHSASMMTALVDDTAVDSGRDEERPARRIRHSNLIEVDKIFAPSQIGREVTAAAAELFDDAHSSNPAPKNDLTMSGRSPTISDQASVQAMSSPIDEDVVETVPDSPLFCNRTISQVSPHQSQDIVVDNDHVSSLSQALQDTTPKNSNNAALQQADSPPKEDTPLQRLSSPTSSPIFNDLISVDQNSDPVAKVPTPQAEDRDSDDAPLCLPQAKTTSLPATASALPAHVRPFRRVVSENVPPMRRSPDASPSHDGSDDDLLYDLMADKVHEKTSPEARNAPVQPQSFSDPIDIHPVSPTIRRMTPASGADDDVQYSHVDDVPIETSVAADTSNPVYIPIEESGPWTLTEAFLLFDRWPPGRQKPHYAMNASITMNATAQGDSVGPSRERRDFNKNSMSKKYGTFGSAKFVSQR